MIGLSALVRRIALLMLLALGAPHGAFAQGLNSSGSAPSENLAVDATQARVALMPSASIIKDTAANKTIEEVMREAQSGNTTRLDKEVFSTGFSSAAYWFVVPLENNQTSPLTRLLMFEPSWLDDVRVTLTDEHGVHQSFVGGDTLAFAQRSMTYRLTNFTLTLPPGKSTLLVRVQTRDPFFVNLRLMSLDSFAKFSASEALYYGLVYGGLLSLLLFNLVLFLSAREKTYLAYCCLLVTFLIMHATYNGHVFQWLFPESPELGGNWINSAFIYFYCFAGLVLALIFLDLKTKLPAAHRWTMRMLVAMGISFVASAVLGGYQAHIITAILWVTVYSVAAFALGLLSLQTRNSAAIYYLAGSVGGLVGSSSTALVAMGFMPYSFVAFRAVDFGMLIDACLLSLALSSRITQGQRLERLRRFFSPAVADQLLSASNEELYRPHRREIVVLFLDLRGYTAFTQSHTPDEVMQCLAEFHAAMGELIGAYGATLERFTGDGMMIFLNDPVEIAEPALRAEKMALEMQARFQQLNTIWVERGNNLSMGIGIAQGVATIGAIGFEGRRDYAAIGNVTNLAARLCSEAGAGQILISNVVAKNIEKLRPAKHFATLTLKGFSEPVECYQITAVQQISHA